MAASQYEADFAAFGLENRRPPDFFRNIDEVAASPPNGYSHILRRAWKSFDDLMGVVSISGRPTIYLQHRNSDGPISIPEQRRFWSHGSAPLLVRVTPREIQVYTGLAAPARRSDDVNDENRLVALFDGTARALELREFIRSVESGAVYARHRASFDPSQAVDRRLVQNLRAARDSMSKGANPPDLAAVHRILGRILFTCYLEARKALLERDFGRLGAGARATFSKLFELPKSDAVRTSLTRLFSKLGRYFRGNLFSHTLSDDLRALRDGDIETLRRLIVGDEIDTGQMVLPFDTYDFSVIPIELVSSVYEDFIRAEDPSSQGKPVKSEQRTKGAFYTPPKLVEFTVDFAISDDPGMLNKRVLDPGCGSGAFLVSIFNRIAEAWVRENPKARNGTRARELARILREQICGVDISLIACQATCFSLYLAMLDFLEPPEIRRLGREGLPSLLLERGHPMRSNGPRTVIQGDFLSAPPALDGQQFDLIVGNPPWVARGNVESESLAHWVRTHPKRRFPIPAEQVACAFMWEASRYLRQGGRACLLVPALVLLGDNTDAFQAQWLKRHCVEKVAQLSDLRFFLFPSSEHPTAAIRFMLGTAHLDQRIELLCPKASHALMFDNLVTVEADDRKALRIEEILSSAARDEAARCWLSYNWATSRDREFLERLRLLRPLGDLADRPSTNKRWSKGQGFSPRVPATEDPKSPFWRPEHPFLDARLPFSFLLSERDTRPVRNEYRELHRMPHERLFKAPLVLFNQGYSNIAFSDSDVLFRHAIQAISGPHTDKGLLMFLTATLLSPLAAYFVFHLTSKSSYRGRALLNEVLRMPFPLPEYAPGEGAFEAVREVEEIFVKVRRDSRFGGFGHDELIDEAKQATVPHVYAYYDVSKDEEILIDDAVTILSQSATPSRDSTVPTLASPTERDRQRYVSTLIRSLSAWSGGRDVKLGARCVLSSQTGLAVLTIVTNSRQVEYTESIAKRDFDQALGRLAALAPDRNGTITCMRNVTFMESDRMHIVKPLTLRFWLRTAALNDADAVAAHLLTRKRPGVTA